MPVTAEFGVRRPFDHVGTVPQAGQGDWPMMSRTMTHVSARTRRMREAGADVQAIVDMAREERVHAVSVGGVQVPTADF